MKKVPPKNVNEIVESHELQKKLQQLGNGDSIIEVSEVDQDSDGYLDQNAITEKWKPCEFDQIQISLFRVGLIDKVRSNLCSDLKTKNEMVVSTKLEGVSGSAHVTYIKQFHDRPEFDKETKDEVAKYQGKILRFLLDRKPEHVFVESLYEDFSPSHSLKKSGVNYNLVKMVFPNNEVPEELNELQREVLVYLSAAFIYAYMLPNVHLHRTLTEGESNSIDAAIKKREIGYGNLILDEREKLATREIEHFFATNPDQEVVLIYGKMHKFEDNFQTISPRPSLTTVSFPSITDKDTLVALACTEAFGEKCKSEVKMDEIDFSNPYITAVALLDTRSQPSIQREIVEKSRTIDYWAFAHISDEAMQLAFLNKLVIQSGLEGAFKKQSHVREWLLTQAVSQKVRDEISEIPRRYPYVK